MFYALRKKCDNFEGKLHLSKAKINETTLFSSVGLYQSGFDHDDIVLADQIYHCEKQSTHFLLHGLTI